MTIQDHSNECLGSKVKRGHRIHKTNRNMLYEPLKGLILKTFSCNYGDTYGTISCFDNKY
jgi:hypothetical protein